jgi:hypothetical protein
MSLTAGAERRRAIAGEHEGSVERSEQGNPGTLTSNCL